MRLLDAEVRDFRGLKGPVRVTFARGLNVVHGMNETGKTTLFEAVRAALTLKARITGDAFKRIQPRSGGTPSVTLSFERAGSTWRLEKKWAGGAASSTRLVEQRDGRNVAEWKADEAEDRLRDLLGLGDPQRGERKPEHLGLWPLLWVEQGTSGEAPGEAVNDASRQALREKLSTMTGIVLGGGVGDEVLRRAEAEEDKYWTSKGLSTKESAPVPIAKQALDAAEARLEALRADALRMEQDEADLVSVEDGLRELARQIPELDADVADAEAAASRAAVLKGEAAAAEQAAQRLASDVERAKLVLEKRAERRAAVEKACAEKETAELREKDLCTRLGTAVEARDAARTAAQGARAAADRATAGSRRVRDAVAWTEARSGHEEAERAHAEARKLEESLQSLEAAQENDAATGKWASEIEELSDAAKEARLRLEAAAARVEITALGASLRVRAGDDVRDLKKGGSFERDLVDTWEAEIGDVAHVRVRPGGEDLGSLRRASEEAASALAHALAEARCADVAGARLAVERRAERGREITRVRKEIKRLAPEGADALAARQATSAARVGELAARLELAGDATSVPGLPADLEALRAALEDAEARESEARTESDEAASAATTAEAQASDLAGEHRGAKVALSRCDDEIGARRQALAEHVEQAGSDEALARTLADAEAEARTARAAAALARQAADAPEVSAAPGRLERARVARRQAEAEEKDLDKRRAVLVDHLEKGRGGGLAEKIAEASAAVASATREHAALLAKARAARRLADALRSAREALEQQFHEPLRKEIEPLLAHLFPQARAAFGAELGLHALQRGHETDAFDELSGGTREQVAVIVRLGLGRVLAGDDGLFVLLDEPLNDTDRARLKAMQDVLARCSDKLQIIVSTSQLERWRGLAADQVIDLAALKG